MKKVVVLYYLVKYKQKVKYFKFNKILMSGHFDYKKAINMIVKKSHKNDGTYCFR